MQRDRGDETVTKRIYLDHWVWIALARADRGDANAAEWKDVLGLARHASKAGLVSFPLSSVHYMELYAGSRPHQRALIGPLMRELSRGHTMRGMGDDVLDMEVDLALRMRTGRPLSPRVIQVFGEGIGHALGIPNFRPRIVDKEGRRPSLTPELIRLELWAEEYAEEFFLTGPPEGADVPGYDPRAHTRFDREFADREKQFALVIADLSKAKHPDMHAARTWMKELLPALTRATAHAGIDENRLTFGSKEALIAFMKRVPSVWAFNELRRVQHENPEHTWASQDHQDINALVMALVYCDAIIPDKHWGHVARRAKLEELRGCRILRTPTELLIELASA